MKFRLLTSHRLVTVVILSAWLLLPASAAAQSYRTYNNIAQLLLDAESDYPTLCRRVNLGTSEQGKPIWALNISDNVGIEEDEPEFKYVSTMHGDEWVGNEMMLYLIDELLGEYGSDAQITNLVNELDIWIVPVMNPDGFAIPQRENIDGEDLNRSFPDRIDDPVNTTAGRPAETAAIMNWSAANSFTLSANLHTGSLVVNYPYDNNASHTSGVDTPSPDDLLFEYISEEYSSRNSPMWNSGSFFHGITNGTDWYVAIGGMQDWNYVWMGCNEVTLELSNTKIPSASQIPTFWNNNRDALLAYMDTALIGVRGIVTDAVSGEPLAATITVVGNSHPVYSDPDIGDYHRMLLPGTYDLVFTADGYGQHQVSNVAVSSGAATRVDVALAPPPAIVTPATLPGGTLNAPYGPLQITANGGQPPYTWEALTDNAYSEDVQVGSAFAETGIAKGWHDDDAYWDYPIAFAFPFYGANYTTLRIHSNGFINFGAISGSEWQNSSSLLLSNRRIAPLWDDLRTDVSGTDIYVDDSQSDRVTVRWDAVTYTGQHPVAVSATLFDTGEIQFDYGPGNTSLTPTIGISNGDGIDYTYSTYNNASTLANAASVVFSPGSTLPPGMVFTASGLLQGTPTQTGTFDVMLRVIDVDGGYATQTFTITISEAAADGDFDQDGDVDLQDYRAFQACIGASSAPCTDAFEFVVDGVVTVDDLAPFTTALSGPAD
ncbi:MAG: carboxypeptidase regulatory-like domain-containing protein [Phycisphaerales bacterium]|nr:carboxypeptidase regulatory-like domain-containing protein [Phycisphaerales bacterium]